MFLCKLPIRRVRHWSCLQTPDGSQPRREATHLRQHYNSPCSNIVFTQPPLEPRPKHPMTTSLVEVLYHTSRPQNICYIQYPSGLLYVPFLRETPSHPPAVIPAFTYCCEQLNRCPLAHRIRSRCHSTFWRRTYMTVDIHQHQITMEPQRILCTSERAPVRAMTASKQSPQFCLASLRLVQYIFSYFSFPGRGRAKFCRLSSSNPHSMDYREPADSRGLRL